MVWPNGTPARLLQQEEIPSRVQIGKFRLVRWKSSRMRLCDTAVGLTKNCGVGFQAILMIGVGLLGLGVLVVLSWGVSLHVSDVVVLLSVSPNPLTQLGKC